jgi:hypothetical protein
MSNNGLSLISLPAPLYTAFQDLAIREEIDLSEAFQLVICGLWGLSTADIRSLPEPPCEFCGPGPEIQVEVQLEKRLLKRLHNATTAAQMTASSVYRRVLYALLVTHQADCIVAGHDAFCILLTHGVSPKFLNGYGPTTRN